MLQQMQPAICQRWKPSSSSAVVPSSCCRRWARAYQPQRFAHALCCPGPRIVAHRIPATAEKDGVSTSSSSSHSSSAKEGSSKTHSDASAEKRPADGSSSSSDSDDEDDDEEEEEGGITPAALLAAENLIGAVVTAGVASLLGSWAGIDPWSSWQLDFGPASQALLTGAECALPAIATMGLLLAVPTGLAPEPTRKELKMLSDIEDDVVQNIRFSVSDSDDSDEDEDEEEEEDGQKESSGKAASTSGTTQGQSQQQQAPAVMAAVQDNSSTNSSSSSSSSSGSSNRDAADSNTGSKEVPSTSGRGLLDLVLPAGTGSSTGSGGASSSSEWAAGLRLWQLWTAKPFYPLVPDAQTRVLLASSAINIAANELLVRGLVVSWLARWLRDLIAGADASSLLFWPKVLRVVNDTNLRWTALAFIGLLSAGAALREAGRAQEWSRRTLAELRAQAERQQQASQPSVGSSSSVSSSTSGSSRSSVTGTPIGTSIIVEIGGDDEKGAVVKVVPQVAAPPTPEDSLVYNLVAALNFTQVVQVSVSYGLTGNLLAPLTTRMVMDLFGTWLVRTETRKRILGSKQ